MSLIQKLAEKIIKVQVEKIESKSMADLWGLTSRSGKIRVYNPSDLVGKKGLEIFDEMVDRDAQVKNSYLLRRLCLIASGWDVIPSIEGNSQAEEQAAFIKHCFQEMDGSIEDSILKLSDAIRQGFKLAEIVYRYIEEGDFKGKVGLRYLKTRNSRNYEFDTDEHGNLTNIIEAPGTAVENAGLNPEKFIINSYGGMDDDPGSIYGISDFITAYKYYYANDIMHRMWALHLEKYSKPTTLVTTKENANPPKAPERAALMAKLQNLHLKTALYYPKTVEIDIKDPPRTKDNAFESMLDWNNQMISKALLLGTLIQQEGKKSGSFALGKKQFDLFYLINKQGMRKLEDLIFESLIKKLIRINFATPMFPKFLLIRPQDPDEMQGKAKVLQILSRIFPIEEELAKEYVGFAQISRTISKTEKRATTEDKPVKDVKPDTSGTTPKPAEKKPDDKFAERPMIETSQGIDRRFEQEKIVNFREIDTDFDQIPANYLSWYAAGEMSARMAVGEWIIKNDILKTGNVALLDRAPINTGALKAVWGDLIRESWVRGARQAALEVKRHKSKEEFAELLYYIPAGKAVGWTPPRDGRRWRVPSKDTAKGAIGARLVESGLELDIRGLDFILPMSQSQLDKIAYQKWYQRAYSDAGYNADSIRKDIRNLTNDAIKDKWTTQRFREEVMAQGVTKAQEAYAMTGLRTETNRAYNEGRVDVFDRVDDVKGYIFSAWLDNRTTDICRELDGQMWPKGDDSYLAYQPPLHMNCRSIMGAVFTSDIPANWDPVPSIKPAEGFGGPVGSRVGPGKPEIHPGY